MNFNLRKVQVGMLIKLKIYSKHKIHHHHGHQN